MFMLSDGSSSALSPIPLCVPRLEGNEWNYLKECLESNFVSSVGPFVERFEQAVAQRVGRSHGVATVNGTAALHVALQVAGVEPNDEVLVSTLTFIAPANAIRYLGAWPVFIDAESAFWQMDVDKVRQFLDHQCRWEQGILTNRQTGRRVRALLPVHILGHPVDMDPLLELAEKYQLVVIEDATESLGAEYKGRKIGQLGHLACFSFNGNKIITTGGGGMIVTENEAWARRARFLTTQAKDDPIEYVHSTIGYNYRLTNLQAAVGCAQMEKLDSYLTAKRRAATIYDQNLRAVSGLTRMREAPWARGIAWLYTIQVDPNVFGLSSRQLLQWLGNAGIQTRPLWQPMHLSQAHAGSGGGACPVADRLWRESLSLPSSVGLTPEEQQRVLATITEATVRAKPVRQPCFQPIPST